MAKIGNYTIYTVYNRTTTGNTCFVITEATDNGAKTFSFTGFRKKIAEKYLNKGVKFIANSRDIAIIPD